MTMDDVVALERTAVQVLRGLDKRSQVVQSVPQADTFNMVFQYAVDTGTLTAPKTFASVGVPQDCVLVSALILAGTDGVASSAAYTVYFATYTNYPTGTAMHLTADKPTLSSAVKVSPSIANWTTKSFAGGSRIWATLDTVSGATKSMTLELRFRKAPVRA